MNSLLHVLGKNLYHLAHVTWQQLNVHLLLIMIKMQTLQVVLLILDTFVHKICY